MTKKKNNARSMSYTWDPPVPHVYRHAGSGSLAPPFNSTGTGALISTRSVAQCNKRGIQKDFRRVCEQLLLGKKNLW
jgi:hypothetical protein